MALSAAKAPRRSAVRGRGMAWVLAAGCLFTVLAQISPSLSVVFTALWLSALLVMAVRHRAEVRFSGMSLLAAGAGVALGAYCSVQFLLTGELGYVDGFFLLYAKCLLMYLVGLAFFSASGGLGGGWRAILAVYILASAVYLAWVLANYFPGLGVWLDSQVYLYSSKNSLGQICGVSAVVLLLAGSEAGTVPRKALCWLLAAALTVGVLLVQCRTAVLAVALSAVFLLFMRRKKRILLVVGAVALLVVLASPALRDFLAHAFFLDKYEGADANAFSSGRFGLWELALSRTSGSELFGLGDYYVDNLYIDIYANLGIVGLLIFMAVWVPRIVVNVRRGLSSWTDGSEMGLLQQAVAALTVFYVVESMLEGQPPFGPGTCSFLFWMACGYLDGKYAPASNGDDSLRCMGKHFV